MGFEMTSTTEAGMIDFDITVNYFDSSGIKHSVDLPLQIEVIAVQFNLVSDIIFQVGFEAVTLDLT